MSRPARTDTGTAASYQVSVLRLVLMSTTAPLFRPRMSPVTA